jgi:hypothetical protein
MRSAGLAACLALVMLAWPAAAQVAPPWPAGTSVGPQDVRVVMDAVFWAPPGPAPETCLQLPPSRVAITVSVEPPQAVRYHFAPYWFRAADSPPEIDVRVTREPRTFEATLAGGRYCYAIASEAADASAPDFAGEPGPAQFVAVRMLLTPR